jgi:ABC-type dipeptide/oligopeptide/nickel transport system ATPase component
MDELVLERLRVAAGARTLVDDATLRVGAGEIVALVGASGSGKTLTARAALGLLPFTPGWVGGQIRVTTEGRVFTPRAEADFRALRGGVLGLLWQDARGALDPLRTVGAQVTAASRLAGDTGRPEDVLARVGFSDPAQVARQHPHALSGGMAQRAALAVALARRSRFLLADEPTTGLDPSVQRGILAHLAAVAASGVGILFVTHDLRLLPGFASRVVVMDAGRTVEEAPTPGALVGHGRALLDATRRIAGGAL